MRYASGPKTRITHADPGSASGDKWHLCQAHNPHSSTNKKNVQTEDDIINIIIKQGEPSLMASAVPYS